LELLRSCRNRPEGRASACFPLFGDLVNCGFQDDIVRRPGFEFGIEHPEAAYRAALDRRLPEQRAAIDDRFA
jgi:hypothetical protein